MIIDSKLNDKELSEMMGISIQTINKWRHGKNMPDIENQAKDYGTGVLWGRYSDRY